MRRFKTLLFFFLLLCFISPFGLNAQSSSTTGNTQFDMTGFPLWAKDLRRGEIIAFGAFPFAYFFSNFGFDTYRFFSNGYDTRYAPWPFAPAAAIEQTQDEKFLTLGIAAGGAVVIALVDYAIMRYKRSKEQGEIRNLPEGTPIINRRPLYEDEDDASAGGD
jgi:hypothetical protein